MCSEAALAPRTKAHAPNPSQPPQGNGNPGLCSKNSGVRLSNDKLIKLMMTLELLPFF